MSEDYFELFSLAHKQYPQYAHRIVMVYYGIVFLTVVLDHEPGNDAVCPGTEVVFTCTTTTNFGFLRWRDTNGEQVLFDNTAFIGKTEQLGNITVNLTGVSGARVYTSTATLNNIMQDTTLECFDGITSTSRTVQLISSK